MSQINFNYTTKIKTWHATAYSALNSGMTPAPLVDPPTQSTASRPTERFHAKSDATVSSIHKQKLSRAQHSSLAFTHLHMSVTLSHRWYDSARTTDAVMLAGHSFHHTSSLRAGGVSHLEPLTSLPCAFPKAKQVGRETDARVSFATQQLFCQGKGVKPRFNPVVFAPPSSLSLLSLFVSGSPSLQR